MPVNLCGLQSAEANRAGLRYLAEDPECWGATPASGASREMRIVSSSLTAKKDTVVSNELRADRMVSDVVEVAAMSGGEINVEFSAGSLDDFMQAFLLGTWSRAMTFDSFKGTNIQWVDSNTVRIGGVDVTAYFTVGRRIKTEGFLKPENNGYFEISAKAYAGGNTNIDVSTSSCTAEAGTSYTKVEDANDVIILKNTAIRAGTSSAKAFDSNGGNAFSSAISAGNLVVGMKIFVQFAPSGYDVGTVTVGGVKETGTITFSAVADDGDTVTLNDGVNTPTVFTFGDGTGGTVDHGVSATTSAQNLKAAITAIGATLDIDASGGATILTLTNNNYTGGAITKSDVDNDYVIVNFSGGTVGPADGDTVTIYDGVDTVIFEWDDDDSFTRGHVQVPIVGLNTTDALALQNAVMTTLWQKKFQVKASVASNVVTLTNIREGFQDVGTIAESGSGTSSSDFAGGDDTTHGFFTVTGLTSDVITVAEDVGTDANGATGAVTIKGSHLRNPGDLDDIIAQSFSIETGFNDVSQYFLQTGMRVGSFGLSFTTGEIVKGQLKLEGKGTSTSQATVLGTTPYDVLETTATPVMNATTNVGDIYKNGEVMSVFLQSLELSGEASLRNQMAVGSKFPAGIGTGRFNLTGKMTAYFETLELYEDFINHNTLGLSLNFLDGDSNAYWFSIPALKITEDPIAPGGIDQDVLEEMQFVAFRDANLDTQFMVDRFSSIIVV